VLAVALAVVALVVALSSGGTLHPGPFYAVPVHLPPGPPGTLIRQQAIPDFYPQAKAYRVLYKSTGPDGRPTAVSGLVIAPAGPAPRAGRKVIAFAHGTVGLAPGCAPSLRGAGAAPVIEGLGQFLAAGYVVAATDYQGLGTPGPQPYMIGRVEAMNALDAVRAAHRLHQVHAGVEYAVWGHSQGGQAALFAGQIAPSYAPGLHLVAVAAGAPVPSMIDFLKVNSRTPAGRVLVAMTLNAWAQSYPHAPVARVIEPAALPSVEAISAQCLYGRQLLGAAPSALAAGRRFVRHPPWATQPWRGIAEQNTPATAPIGVPVLVTQGTADKVVPARLTKSLVRRMCAAGETVELRLYPSAGHLEAGVVASPDVAGWIAQRFAGAPAPSSCPAGAP
jgi:pimeloyl-ACP methyl ester carboxylesterase